MIVSRLVETIARIIPVLGPLLADPNVREFLWWAAALYVAIGFFPEETTLPDGTVKRSWHFGGLVRAFIQQSTETRELRFVVGALVARVDRVITVLETKASIRVPDSDPPPVALDIAPSTKRKGVQ